MVDEGSRLEQHTDAAMELAGVQPAGQRVGATFVS
jgi:hypothetical protein